MMRGAMPDIQWKIEETISEDNKILVRYTMTGTQTQPLMGMPATGRKICVTAMNIYEFKDGKTSVAPHWYIRHGARDRDTAFPVPINFATKLQNAGKEVNFLLAWNRPHSGDYALDELFQWIAGIVSE